MGNASAGTQRRGGDPAPPATDSRLLLMHPGDNVLVLRAVVAAGEELVLEGRRVALPFTLGLGHKIARSAIATGDKVVKYGAPIGTATGPIAPGDHVHLHNLKSDHTPSLSLTDPAAGPKGVAP